MYEKKKTVRWTPEERNALANECLIQMSTRAGILVRQLTTAHLARFKRILAGQILRDAQRVVFAEQPDRIRPKVVSVDCLWWLYPALEAKVERDVAVPLSEAVPAPASKEKTDPELEDAVEECLLLFTRGLKTSLRSYIHSRALHLRDAARTKHLEWLKSLLTGNSATLPVPINHPRLPRGIRAQFLFIGYPSEHVDLFEDLLHPVADVRVWTSSVTAPLRELIGASYLVFVGDYGKTPVETTHLRKILLPMAGHKLRLTYGDYNLTQRLIEEVLPD